MILIHGATLEIETTPETDTTENIFCSDSVSVSVVYDLGDFFGQM